MDSHPIPKNLMDIELKIFGVMTFKQFGSIAACFLFGVVAYISPLPTIFRYPLVAIFVLFGFLLGFYRVHGQTFDKFLMNFFLAMLSPQRRIWKKINKVPEPLKTTSDINKQDSKIISERKESLLDEILSSGPVTMGGVTEGDGDIKPVDDYEEKIIANIDKYIENGKNNHQVSTAKVENHLSNQNQINNQGKIEKIFGKVIDKDMRPLRNIKIQVTSVDGNFSQELITNLNGIFVVNGPLNAIQYLFSVKDSPEGMRFIEQKVDFSTGNKEVVIQSV